MGGEKTGVNLLKLQHFQFPKGGTFEKVRIEPRGAPLREIPSPEKAPPARLVVNHCHYG